MNDRLTYEAPLQAITSPWGRRRPVDSPFDKTLPTTPTLPLEEINFNNSTVYANVLAIFYH